MAAPSTTPPRDDLVRAVYPGAELREVDESDGRPRLIGHFARFDEWTLIDSVYEGRFMERIAPGAFSQTIAEDRDAMRVLFQHGRDPVVGDKPIATIETLEEDKDGARYVALLLDARYVRDDLEPGLRAGVYGASFRFDVPEGGDIFEPRPRKSKHNPDGLPERTITRARVYEFGPVTWPAYPGATAGVRSLTDRFRDQPAEQPAQTREPEPEPIPTGDKETKMEYITRDEKDSRRTELRAALAAIAGEHTGVLPTDVQERWTDMTNELDRLDADIAAYDARMEMIRRFGQDEKHVDQPAPPAVIVRKTEADIYDIAAIVRGSRTNEERDQKFRDNAIRATEQMRTPSQRYDQDKSREKIVSLLEHGDSEDREVARRILATNSPQYREAFNRYVRSGGSERGTALAVGVDATGGYAVPVSLDPTILAIGAHTAINPYRASCRIETITGTDTWQALTATAITAAYATEAAAATEQGPTFARPEYVAKRAHAFVTVSYEMAQDRPGLPAELGTLFGEAKDNLEENQFTIGVGTTVYPQGIGLKDAFTRVDSITNDVHAVGDVLAVEAALPIRHRLNAAWYLCRAAIRAIQAYETTGGQLFNGAGYPAVGNPVNRPTGNTGLTLLGYPVWETPSMPWTPTTDDTTWGVLMDPRNYVILDRIGMSIKVIPDMLNGATPSFPTGEIGIYAFWRGTARVLNVDGGRQGAIQ